MEEVFKDIKGYEGRYQVSNLGNVYSTPQDGKPNRVLKQEVNKKSHTNYRRVSLSKEGKVIRFLVHRLVAEAFIPNPENKPDINHIDCNGENNATNNLEWCTHSENMKHAIATGNMTVHLTNGHITGEKKRKETIKKFTKLLKKKLIEVLPIDEDGRTYIKFYCGYCNNIHTSRTDSITANTGYCGSCRRRNKHQITKED